MLTHDARGPSDAFLLGVVAGLATRSVEYATGLLYRVEPALSLEGLAAYGLAGGGLGALGRFLSQWLPSPIRSLGATGAFAVPSLAVLYFVNVRVFPSLPYSSPAGLALNAASVLALFGVSWWLTHRLGFDGQAGFPPSSRRAAIPICCLLAVILAVRWPTAPRYPERSGAGPNLLLIVLDAARRDHLGVYGYERPTSPRLDARTSRSRIYETALAGSTWTAPSVDLLLRPAADGPTVQERLATAGYNTACLTDNPNVGPASELARGFDLATRSVSGWRTLLRRTALHVFLERLWPGTDEDLVQRAVDWAARESGPIFAYIHLMEVHAPYEHAPIDAVRRPGRRIVFPQDGTEMTAAERQDIIARYDGAIRHVDGLVDRLLVSAEGWGRPYLAIITADHGERLGEGGRWGHGGEIDAPTLRVPLVVIGDGVVPGRVPAAVGAASVARTLLAAAGLECRECPGSDLRKSAGDASVEGGVPPGQRYRGRGEHLLIESEGATPRLFDLAADPSMLRDIAADNPQLVAGLRAELGPRRSVPRPSPDDIERLRALGYIQ